MENAVPDNPSDDALQNTHHKLAIGLNLYVRDSILRLVCDRFTLAKIGGRRELIEDRKG
jgi:hypothetical protein